MQMHHARPGAGPWFLARGRKFALQLQYFTL